MTPMSAAVHAGLRRGLIEFRQFCTSAQDLIGQLFWPVALLVTLFFMRGSTFPGTDISLGTLLLPSAIGMMIAMNGLMGMTGLLVVEREDGTLLRAKATPYGMVGYLIGKVVAVAAMMLAGVIILLVPGIFMVDGLAFDSVGAWLTLVWVVLLGLVATLPLGAVFGSLIDNPRSTGLLTLPLTGLIAISGIFYPISGMPDWLAVVAQVFPVYWLGLGVRSALLPNDAAAIEIGESWRHLETVAVLGAWAVLGLVLAPIVLRRMARRESGSRVAQRREKAMQRIN